MASLHVPECIFCKIILGELPSHTLAETDKSIAFMDIRPLSPGHTLVVPKHHFRYFHELDDAYLVDMVLLAKRIAGAGGWENYNILQNNGNLAYQEVDHAHFHIIPKPNAEHGLRLARPKKKAKCALEVEEMKEICNVLKRRL